MARLAPQFVSRQEIEQLLTEARNDQELAILRLLYNAALRVSEVAGLRCEAINRQPQRWTIDLIGKGRKTHTVYLAVGSVTQLALKAWLGNRVAGWVFPRADDPSRPIDRFQIWRLVRRASERAGIHGVHPHTFRHSRATHLLASGLVDLRQVQELLNHASIATTQIYTHVTADQLERAVAI